MLYITVTILLQSQLDKISYTMQSEEQAQAIQDAAAVQVPVVEPAKTKASIIKKSKGTVTSRGGVTMRLHICMFQE